MLQWKRDLIISIAVLVFSVFNIVFTSTMNTDVIEYGLAKPGNYVRMWLILFAILAVVLLIRSLKNKTDAVAAPIWHRAAVITVIATAAYLFLMPYLGFCIMTVLFLSGLGLLYTYYMKTKLLTGKTLVKEIIKWLLFSILTTVILYLLFAELLNVVLPGFALL